MTSGTHTDPVYYLTAPSMAYPRGRVLRIGTDGTLALHDKGQWRDLEDATDIPDGAHPITARDAAGRVGQSA